jgi:PhzF family phenazine biosynthesis protein
MNASPLSFSIVDVFAENKYEGNQLAVFRHGAHLTTEEMLAIAREMNYSETTIKRPSILYHRARQLNDHISIQIGGKTIYTAKGEWA